MFWVPSGQRGSCAHAQGLEGPPQWPSARVASPLLHLSLPLPLSLLPSVSPSACLPLSVCLSVSLPQDRRVTWGQQLAWLYLWEHTQNSEEDPAHREGSQGLGGGGRT